MKIAYSLELLQINTNFLIQIEH